MWNACFNEKLIKKENNNGRLADMYSAKSYREFLETSFS